MVIRRPQHYDLSSCFDRVLAEILWGSFLSFLTLIVFYAPVKLTTFDRNRKFYVDTTYIVSYCAAESFSGVNISKAPFGWLWSPIGRKISEEPVLVTEGTHFVLKQRGALASIFCDHLRHPELRRIRLSDQNSTGWLVKDKAANTPMTFEEIVIVMINKIINLFRMVKDKHLKACWLFPQRLVIWKLYSGSPKNP